MNKLVIPIAMQPGEYLPGALVRATELNGLVKTSDVLRMAAIFGVAASVASQNIEIAEGLATAIGADSAVVTASWHSDLPENMCNFFGAQIRKQHRLVSTRRVAPRTLQDSPYHRAMWQLKPISFDLHTLERLLSHCPVCRGELGFTVSLGVWACDRCGGVDDFGLREAKVDLRDHPQEILEVNDREALDFVLALVDPTLSATTWPNVSLHESWTNMTRGEVFEAAVALSCVIASDHCRVERTIGRPIDLDQHAAVYTPDKLAAAGRMIMDWPRGFHDFCDKMRETTADRGHHGMKAELGPICALATDRSILPSIRAVFDSKISHDLSGALAEDKVRRADLRQNDGLITLVAASAKYHIAQRAFWRFIDDPRIESYSSNVPKAPKLFRERQIAEIAARTAKLETIGSVSARLGIPKSAVLALGEAGLIKREDQPHALIATAAAYHRKSVNVLANRLVEALLDTASLRKRPMALVTAMGRLPGAEKPWVEIVQAILTRKVRVFGIGNENSPIFARLAIGSLDDVVSMELLRKVELDPAEKITVPEASMVIGVSTHVVRDLIVLGKLEAGCVKRADAVKAAQELIFNRELFARFELPRGKNVREQMALIGVQPLFMLREDRGFAYSRKKVMAAMERRAKQMEVAS